METGVIPECKLCIEARKKEKLRLKDSLYAILRKAENTA